MIHYKIRRDQLRNEDMGRYIAYGIDVFDGEELIRTVKDVSPTEKKLQKLISLCNRLQLSPVHLDDVIEDFLE